MESMAAILGFEQQADERKEEEIETLVLSNNSFSSIQLSITYFEDYWL